MIDKIKVILGSVRFYIATFAWLSDYLAKIAVDGFDLVVLFNQLALWLGTVAAIGTADSIAQNLSSKKK
jgi:hypothetical protein